MPGPPAPRGTAGPAATARSHGGRGAGGSGHCSLLVQERGARPCEQSPLRKAGLLRELRRFVCNRQAFPSLLALFFFNLKKKIAITSFSSGSPSPATACNNPTGSPSWYLAPELSSAKQARRKTSLANPGVLPPTRRSPLRPSSSKLANAASARRPPRRGCVLQPEHALRVITADPCAAVRAGRPDRLPRCPLHPGGSSSRDRLRTPGGRRHRGAGPGRDQQARPPAFPASALAAVFHAGPGQAGRSL